MPYKLHHLLFAIIVLATSLQRYNSLMGKKKSLQVYLDDYEREEIEQISARWGCSLSAAIKRLIREQATRSNLPNSQTPAGKDG